MGVKLSYLYRAYRYRLRVDPAEIRYVSESLLPGQVAADVGCHKGAYTYWMRRSVGASGAVYAFEPQARQVAYLHDAFSAMQYDNVAVVPMAVSDHCGELPLHLPEGAGRSHMASLELHGERPRADQPRSTLLKTSSTVQVKVTTLDDFFETHERRPNFVKIDVEGHELAVLHGARRLLERQRPALLIECEVRHRPDRDVRTVFELLEGLGYEGSFFLGRARRPLAEFDPAVHQRLDAANPDRLPRGYVNNFAFEAKR